MLYVQERCLRITRELREGLLQRLERKMLAICRKDHRSDAAGKTAHVPADEKALADATLAAKVKEGGSKSREKNKSAAR